MKYLLIFTLALAALTLAFATSAQAAKATQSEPVDIPNEDQEGSSEDENRPGSFEETYEGNDREEEYSDLFSARFTPLAPVIKQVTEDRGSVLVITTTRLRDSYPGDTCAYITVQIVDKKSGKVVASDSIRSCEEQIF